MSVKRAERDCVTRKFFVTKYALTMGIKEMELEQSRSGEGCWYGRERSLHDQFVQGRTCFETLDHAIANAEHQKMRKIASLAKQIARLEKLQIRVVK